MTVQDNSGTSAQHEWLKKHAFKPGQSGNPKGRPPGVLDRRTIVRALLEAEDETTKLPNSVAMTVEIVKKAKGGDLHAWNALMDSGHGKVADKTELTGRDGEAIKTETVLPEHDRAILDHYFKTKGITNAD